jgi:hypothetical protein
MFRTLHAHPNEGLHKRHLVYCVRQLAVPRLQYIYIYINAYFMFRPYFDHLQALIYINQGEHALIFF